MLRLQLALSPSFALVVYCISNVSIIFPFIVPQEVLQDFVSWCLSACWPFKCPPHFETVFGWKVAKMTRHAVLYSLCTIRFSFAPFKNSCSSTRADYSMSLGPDEGVQFLKLRCSLFGIDLIKLWGFVDKFLNGRALNRHGLGVLHRHPRYNRNHNSISSLHSLPSFDALRKWAGFHLEMHRTRTDFNRIVQRSQPHDRLCVINVLKFFCS